MISNTEILTWEGQVAMYKTKFTGAKSCFLGVVPMWEYQMLVDSGAINEREIREDGYTVRDSKDNLLYYGNNKASAMDAKTRVSGAYMSKGSYMYSSYCDYEGYLAFKERQEKQ